MQLTKSIIEKNYDVKLVRGQYSEEDTYYSWKAYVGDVEIAHEYTLEKMVEKLELENMQEVAV